jgi:hypothetical protein
VAHFVGVRYSTLCTSPTFRKQMFRLGCLVPQTRDSVPWHVLCTATNASVKNCRDKIKKIFPRVMNPQTIPDNSMRDTKTPTSNST